MEPTPRRRLLADRAATWTVTAGGMAIIASILGILVFILVEVVPLGSGADVRAGEPVAIDVERPLALLVDEQRERTALLDASGAIVVADARDGATISRQPLAAGRILAGRAIPGASAFVALDAEGGVLVAPVDWRTTFVGDERRIDAEIPPPVRVAFEQPIAGDAPFAARAEGDDVVAAALVADGTIVVRRRSVDENEFTGEVDERLDRFVAAAPPGVDALLLAPSRRDLFATSGDALLWWRVGRDGLEGPRTAATGGDPVTAISLLIGGRSLVAGHRSGELSIWFPLGTGADAGLHPVRRFEGDGAAIRAIAPSWRDKGFVALDADGGLGLHYSTSHRTLWRGAGGLGGDAALTFAPKANGVLLAADGRLAGLEVDNPHPEVGLRALLGRVWYEGRRGPEFIWQSSGGSDEFEPKLSLVPLIVGTLKGTFYSLVLAVPLAVLGAMYTSQFTHPSFRNVVKPTVEIMAALPSVVLGFLAGLWLAPRMEQVLPSLIVMAVAMPPVVIAAGFAWRAMPRTLRVRMQPGSEVGLYALVLVVVGWLAIAVGPLLERGLFGDDMPLWLLESLGLAYDQRNAVVVGLAMGFAVIPIIYSVAEDAFSNVPQNLVSGSLALGANRWQTVTRVVLPTASPGIFSAIMIGFGRAVGETMIVLMATGNTPIMDWNPFNGFRTLSANIAVEIPEAPHGGTLYRTLFLAALLLFVFTFAINTAAEFVRQRLRRRYAQL